MIFHHILYSIMISWICCLQFPVNDQMGQLNAEGPIALASFLLGYVSYVYDCINFQKACNRAFMARVAVGTGIILVLLRLETCKECFNCLTHSGKKHQGEEWNPCLRREFGAD